MKPDVYVIIGLAILLSAMSARPEPSGSSTDPVTREYDSIPAASAASRRAPIVVVKKAQEPRTHYRNGVNSMFERTAIKAQQDRPFSLGAILNQWAELWFGSVDTARYQILLIETENSRRIFLLYRDDDSRALPERLPPEEFSPGIVLVQHSFL